MTGSDDSISSGASSGSDGEHPSHASITPAQSSCRAKRRRDGSSTPSSGTIRHRHRHKLSHRFEFVRTLGCGTYGKVKLAIQLETGKEVAIKCVPKSKIDNVSDLRRLRQEIEVMSSLHHPHIIEVTEVFESRDKIVMVMEHACGGELYDYINDGKMAPSQAKELFRQIVSAVHYLHKNGIVHRDLKLENVLLDCDNNVKIADFGLSSMFDRSNLLDTFCGSPLYASPEIINGTPYYGPEVDCWSLGVILYAMVYKTMPFHGADFSQLKSQITEGSFFEPSDVSGASDLIHRMLSVDPRERIAIDDILNHPWLSGTGAPSISSQREPSTGQKHSSDCFLFTEDTKAIHRPEAAKKPLAGILKKSVQQSRSSKASEEQLLSVDAKSRWETTATEPQDRDKENEPVKKGILKKRVKDGGRDSGLGINEEEQSRSGASLGSGSYSFPSVSTVPEKCANKRDSGIDQDLVSCCGLQECERYETCHFESTAAPEWQVNLGDISKRHSRGKYSKIAKVWESIYTSCVVSDDVTNIIPPTAVQEEEVEPTVLLPVDVSNSSNEDILEILSTPALRTIASVERNIRCCAGVTMDYSETIQENVTCASLDDQEERYTTDELMSAMDEELLEVYQKALRISEAVA